MEILITLVIGFAGGIAFKTWGWRWVKTKLGMRADPVPVPPPVVAPPKVP